MRQYIFWVWRLLTIIVRIYLWSCCRFVCVLHQTALYLTGSEPARRWWSAFGTNKTWTTECIHSSGLFHEFIVLPAAGLFIQYWVQYRMLFFFSLYCFIWFFFSSGFLNCNAPVICMAAAHLTVINIGNAIPLAVLRCFIQYLIDSIIFGGFRQCSRGTGGCGVCFERRMVVARVLWIGVFWLSDNASPITNMCRTIFCPAWIQNLRPRHAIGTWRLHTLYVNISWNRHTVVPVVMNLHSEVAVTRIIVDQVCSKIRVSRLDNNFSSVRFAIS